MSFISDLHYKLVNDEPVDDLSRNEKFTDFSFVGLKETALTVDVFAFTKADGLDEPQIAKLCDQFFNIVRIISYDDFGLNPGPRNPNGLLCFVFEDGCPASLREFITTQTRISHWGESAVSVPWLIDLKQKRIYTHRNPVSWLPPVVISKWLTFPSLNYLKLFLNSRSFQSSHSDSKTTLQSFDKLEKQVEEVYSLFKSAPRKTVVNYFTNAKIATIINEGEMHIKSSEVGELTLNNAGDTYNVGQAGAVGKYARSDSNTFSQSEKQPLAEAALEIQTLLKQLEQTNPSATEGEKLAYVTDETTPSFKRRAASALRESGEAAVDEFVLENKYLKVVKAAIKGWLQPNA